MVLKVLGAATVILTAVAFEKGLSRERRAATAQLAGFLTLFRAIRLGIEAYTPVGEILARADEGTLLACSGGGRAVRGESLASLIRGCVFLSDGLGVLMERAAGELGRGYHDDQLAVCDGYVEALEALHRECVKKERELSACVRPLLAAASAGVVILLI